MALLLLPCFYCVAAAAQDIQNATEEKLEDLSESLQSEIEDDSYWQNLVYYKTHPLNINTATKEELHAFLFLTDLQIDNFIHYRQLLGTLLNIYELQSVPGWNTTAIKRLLPYVTVAASNSSIPSLLQKFKGGEHSMVIREAKVLEKSKGYNTAARTHFMGSSDNIFLRYKYRYKNELQYGLVATKGAGEPFFKGNNACGFDFYSAHLFAREKGFVQTIALGDFTVNMGQGLIQWQTLAFKKTADIAAIKRQSAILKPYNSAGEFYFHRGAGITVRKGAIEATAFASYHKINANTKWDAAAKEEVLTSFVTSSLHRTPSEILDKNSTGQTTLGGNISYAHQAFSIGINAIGYQFEHPIQKRKELYNLYAISGSRWFNASIDYSATMKNVHLFGEAAVDKNFDKALVSGALISIGRNIDASLLYRNISKAYQSLYSNAFTESTAPTNERGLYIGLSYRPAVAWRLDAYADFFKSPYLKYRINGPSQGYEYLAQATYQPSKKWEACLRYKYETKPNNLSGSNTDPVNKPKQDARVNISYILNGHFTFRSRVEALQFDCKAKDAARGFLSYADVFYKHNAKFSANIRLQYFKTDDYNSRIYTYEQDVLYSYSIPVYYDQGIRYYANTSYDMGKRFTCWLRWSQTIYAHKKTIGSGLDEIKGNTKSEIRLQLQYHFN